jgi:hypothetical protein
LKWQTGSSLEINLVIAIFITMKHKNKSYKTVTWELLGYEKHKQLHGGYKVIKYMKLSDNSRIKKSTIHKDLTETDAEDIIYRLERNNKF